MKIARDRSGAKVLKIEASDFLKSVLKPRCFTVPTQGNLPKTHEMCDGYFDPVTALFELEDYVEKHGTDDQKITVSQLLDRKKIRDLEVDLRPQADAFSIEQPIQHVASAGSRTEVFDL